MTRRGWSVCLLLGSACWLPSDLSAQETPADSVQVLRNAIHLGFGGVSSITSINYERELLKNNELGVLVRIGLGSIHLKDYTRRFNPDLLFPIGLYATYGRRLMAEIGAGGTYSSIVYPDEQTFMPSRRSDMHGWCSLGIRGNITDHFWLRVAYTPIFEFGRATRSFELCTGYRF